jgi:type II secretory pathway pseudopilin PulG
MRTPACAWASRSGRRPAAGFTLAELLGAILIVVLLIVLIVPAHKSLRQGIERRQAAADCRMLVQAALQFRQVYGAWPLQDRMTPLGEIVFADASLSLPMSLDPSNIVAVLRGADAQANPRGTVFLRIPEDRLDRERFLDPWGRPYLLMLDADGKSYVNLPTIVDPQGSGAPLLVGQTVRESAVALSLGDPRDARDANQRTVVSWREP